MSEPTNQAQPQDQSEARAQLRTHALTFPGAYEEYPWGQVVVKVNKKVFLFLDGDPSDPGLNLSVKLPTTGADILSLPFTRPTGYGLGKSGWVSFHFDPGEQAPLELLYSCVGESYRAMAPKRLLKELDRHE